MYIDTHCHLDDPKILPDVKDTVSRFETNDVKIAITMGCEVNTSLICRDLSDKFNSVYFGAGIHPMDVDKCTEEDLKKIEKLLSHPKCVVVGEIGIDLYWDKTYREKQIEYFEALIDIAYRNALPINVHMRDATLDTLNTLKANKNKLVYGGVLHCYNGSKETLKEVLDLGLCVGFGGTSTFKNARNVLEVIPLVPKDRILTETDSPFLTPEPFRGKVNTPEYIPVIAEKIASVRGESVEELKENVLNNAKRLFRKIKL